MELTIISMSTLRISNQQAFEARLDWLVIRALIVNPVIDNWQTAVILLTNNPMLK